MMKRIDSKIKRESDKFRKNANRVRSNIISRIDPTLYFMEDRLVSWRNRFVGTRCFIMGNGPSLNRMDLSLFKNEYIWGSNRCYLLYPRINWRPSFYTAVDTRVVPDNKREINDIIRKEKQTRYFLPAKFRKTGLVKSRENVFWFNEIPQNQKNLPYSHFSVTAEKFIYTVNTVTMTALQLAVHMGFNPIYLIGCDTSYTINKSVNYEGGNKDLLISSKDDVNHFDKSYFGQGKRWHAPKVEHMITNYQQGKKICDAIGVRVFNATVGGNLEVFPRVDYIDLF